MQIGDIIKNNVQVKDNQRKNLLVNNANRIGEEFIQWNPSITDTIWTSKLDLLMEVSCVEGSFNMI